MQRMADMTTSWASWGLQWVALVLQFARDHRERMFVFLVPLILLAPVVIVAGTWRYEQAVRTPVIGTQAERPWRYLLVCEKCGHRERLTESPHQTRAKQAGFFECPQCGAFMASSYRRGSLALPPGGW